MNLEAVTSGARSDYGGSVTRLIGYLAVSFLVFQAEARADSVLTQFREALAKPLAVAYPAAQAVLEDPDRQYEREDQIDALWKSLAEHLENRSNEVSELELSDAFELVRLLGELYEIVPDAGIAGALRVAPYLPEQRETLADLVFFDGLEPSVEPIEMALAADLENTLPGLMRVLSYVEMDDDFSPALPWLKTALQSGTFEDMVRACEIIQLRVAHGTPIEFFEAAREELMAQLETLWNRGAPTAKRSQLIPLSRVALTTAQLVGESIGLTHVLRGLYSLRGSKTLPLRHNQNWLDAIQISLGREYHPLNDEALARGDLVEVQRALKRTLKQPASGERSRAIRELATAAAVAMYDLRKSPEWKELLNAMLSPSQEPEFRAAVAAELTSFPETEAQTRAHPACADLLKDAAEEG